MLTLFINKEGGPLIEYRGEIHFRFNKIIRFIASWLHFQKLSYLQMHDAVNFTIGLTFTIFELTKYHPQPELHFGWLSTSHYISRINFSIPIIFNLNYACKRMWWFTKQIQFPHAVLASGNINSRSKYSISALMYEYFPVLSPGAGQDIIRPEHIGFISFSFVQGFVGSFYCNQ